MVLIELKKIVKEGLFITLILVALMVYILTTDKDPHFASVVFEILLLIYASFAGWSMFERERQDNAEEYLLSMPVSRTRLFLLKFIPRAFSVMMMLGGYLLLHHYFDFPSILPYFDFSLFYVTFFLVSISFSISIRSFIGALFFTSFLSVGLTLLIKTLDPTIPDSSAILTANLVVLVFPLIFFIVFQTFDIKSIRAFNLKFVPPLLVIMGVILAVTWFSTGTEWEDYYLTHGGDVIRISHTSQRSQLIQGDKITPFKGCALPLLEEKGHIYMQMKKKKKVCRLKYLVNLDLQKNKIYTLLEPGEGWFMGKGVIGKNGVLLNGIYYNILRNYTQKEYEIIIITDGLHVRKIPIFGNFHEETIWKLFHVVEKPLQFLVMTKWRIYRIFESGNAEEVFFIPKALAVWRNRLLTFDKKGITLYELSDQVKQVFRKEGSIRKILREYGTYTSPNVLMRKERSYYLFDMENQSFQAVDMHSKPKYYHISDNIIHLLWIRGCEITYGRMENGKIKDKKKLNVKVKDDVCRKVIPYPWGLIVFNGNEYEKFLFKKILD